MNTSPLLTFLLKTVANGSPMALASYAFALAFGLTAGVLTACSLFNVLPGQLP